MSEIISFLVSVLASVVGYYICKWLDGDRKHININMLNNFKTKESGWHFTPPTVLFVPIFKKKEVKNHEM